MATTYEYISPGEINVKDGAGKVTQLKFTAKGELQSIQDPLNRSTAFTYDANGYLSQILAPGNTVYKYSYDASGRLLSQTDPLNKTVSFTYSGSSEAPVTVKDQKGNVLTYGYDASGNLTGITYGTNQSETFTYDASGRLTKATERSGDTFTYGYDSAGRLTKKTFKDNTYEAYTYNGAGNLATVRDVRGGVTALTYDANNWLTKIAYPGGRFLSYTYDALGWRTQMKDQAGFTTNYSYDSARRLAELKNASGARIVAYGYDAAGRLIKETNGNGTYTSYAYDAAGQLLKIANYKADNSVNSFSEYTYDSLGRQTTAKSGDGTWTYTYDATGQLSRSQLISTNASIANQDLQYVYDAAGNRIRTIENGVTKTYTTNALNQYTQVGAAVYTYDLDGNLTKVVDGAKTFTYTYNAENRLTKAVTPDGTFEYVYDALGNRTASIANGVRTDYLVDPFGLGDVVGEYNGTSLVANYAHGLGLVGRFSGSGAAYYDSDAIGSTIGLTNAAGSYVNRYAYRPFGEDLLKTEGVANGFEYVGQLGVMDEASGLDYMRARYYTPGVGRFINPDPIGMQSGDLNFYRYVFNNPISLFDASGLCVEPDLYKQLDDFSNMGYAIASGGAIVAAFTPILPAAAPTGGILVAIGSAIALGSLYAKYTNQPCEPDEIPPEPRNPAPYPNQGGENLARGRFDPLVLDLDGDGIELVSIDQSTAQFDLNADGFREQTGWVKGDDGMLALDANGDGKINDIRELFGDALTDGFDELKTLDTNNDKIIDLRDTQFGQLKIWRDINQNGLTETGELKTLAQTGVKSISLNTQETSYISEGSLIRSVSQFTRTNNTTSEIASLWFDSDRLNTTYNLPYQLKTETLFLPTVRGYGKLPDLYISMSLDSQLLGLMREFAQLKLQNLSQVIPKVEAILFRWAKVDAVAPDSRGQFFDARKLGFLESFLGQPINLTFNNLQQTRFLQQSWDVVVQNIAARLTVQGAMSGVFANTTYSLNTDMLTTSESLSALLTRLVGAQPTNTADIASYWSHAITVLDNHVGRFGLAEDTYNLSGAEKS